MEQFVRMLVECTLTMSAIALALLAFTPALTRRYSAKGLYAAWLVVLIGLAVPFRPQPAPAAIRVPVRATSALAPTLWGEQTALLSQGGGQQTEPLAPKQEAMQAGGEPSGNAAPRLALPSLTGGQWVFLAWLIGAGITLSARLRSHRRFLRAVRRWSKPIENETYQAELRRVKAELSITAPIALYRCKTIDSPMLMGLARPRILLPDENFSLAETYLVLRHELIHFKRRDLWGRLLLMLVSAVHWFNPLMIPIARAFGLQCEASCDADVTRGMNAETRQYYSQTILRSLRGHAGVSTALSTRFLGGKRMIKRRILNILDPRRKKLGTVLVSCLLAAVLGGGMAFALSPAEEAVPGAAQAELTPLEQVNAALVAKIRTPGWSFEYGETPIYTWAFSEETFDPEALTETVDALNACETPEELLALLDAYGVGAPRMSAEMRAYVQEIFSALGLDLPYMGSSYTHDYWGEDATPPTGYTYSWSVLALNDTLRGMTTNGGMLAGYEMSLAQGKDVQQLFLNAEGTSLYNKQHESRRAITPEERERALAKAVSFAGAYMGMEEADPSGGLVSGYVYQNAEESLIEEPYTFVWLMDTRPGRQDGEEFVAGQVFTIGVTTQAIYSISGVDEPHFAMYAEADAEWAEKHGETLPSPVIGRLEYFEIIVQEIGGLVDALMYGELNLREQLTAQEQARVWGLTQGLYNDYAYEADDWRALLEALKACDSAEGLMAIVDTDYVGINQSPRGLPSREELLALIEEMLPALGYPEHQPAFFAVSSYGRAYAEDTEATFAIGAGEAGEDTGEYIQMGVTEKGKLITLSHRDNFIDETTDLKSVPVTEEARLAVRGFLEVVAEHLDVPALDLDGMRVAESMHENIRGSHSVNVAVPFAEEGPAGRGMVMLTIDAATGRIDNLWIDEDAGYEEEYLATPFVMYG